MHRELANAHQQCKLLTYMYIIKNTPFQLLLGHPFHSLLLSCLEDNTDGSVSLLICDPANQSCTIQVPTKACHTTIGFISTLAFQTYPPLPQITTLECYGAQVNHHTTTLQLDATPPTFMLAYKKAAKKVHLVAALLPEDFHIVC